MIELLESRQLLTGDIAIAPQPSNELTALFGDKQTPMPLSTSKIVLSSICCLLTAGAGGYAAYQALTSWPILDHFLNESSSETANNTD